MLDGLRQGLVRFYTFDAKGEAEDAVELEEAPNAEQSLPVIVSDSSQVYAMGFYSPDSPQGSPYSGVGYGLADFGGCCNTVKLNNVFRFNGSPYIATGSHYFRTYVIVGSLSNVIVTMQQLRATIG